jgi:hypothetical protein
MITERVKIFPIFFHSHTFKMDRKTIIKIHKNGFQDAMQTVTNSKLLCHISSDLIVYQ